MFYGALGRVGIRAISGTSFSPILLFANGEQGAWYDPSDLNSYMSSLGAELVTNGDFSSGTTGWAATGSCSIANVGGELEITHTAASNGALQTISGLTVGHTYRVAVTGRRGTGNIWNFLVGSSAGTSPIALYLGDNTSTSNATVVGYFVAAETSHRFYVRAGTTPYPNTAYINNVSVKEVTSISQATMFQDSAGTTPVTAVEQPVGLLLDKSKGLALGAELVTNGDFSGGTTGWTASASTTLSTDAGRLKVTAGSTFAWAYQALTTVIGRTYKLTYSIINGDAVGCYMYVDTAAGSSASNYNSGLLADGTYSAVFVATSTTTYVKPFIQGSGKFAFFDNISVKELAGNHASQSTAASRPVLSARVNLLTYSEQFDNAAWTKASASVTTGTTSEFTAPDGTTNADKLIVANAASGGRASQTFTLATSPHTFSVCGKAGEWSWLVLSQGAPGSGQEAYFNLSSGTVGTVGAPSTATITNLGNGWYRCSLTFTASGISSTYRIIPTNADNTTSTGDGTSGIYLWGADLRVTNVGVGLPAYQRVAAATDYDTSGFPLYLKFDGTDDSLATGSIDFTATDKMSVFAGVRKLSDALQGVIIETSSDVTTNNGTVLLRAPGSIGVPIDGYSTVLRGTQTTGSRQNTFTAPISNVVAWQLNIAGAAASDEIIFRANGVVNASGGTGGLAANAGTGNFGNYPLYIGRRGGTTAPYNGHLYSLIVRGALSTDAQIASTETWVNGKTGAY